MELWQQLDAQVCWPVTQAYLVSTRLLRDSVSKTSRWYLRKNTWGYPLSSTYTHTCIYMYMNIHRHPPHTHIHMRMNIEPAQDEHLYFTPTLKCSKICINSQAMPFKMPPSEFWKWRMKQILPGFCALGLNMASLSIWLAPLCSVSDEMIQPRFPGCSFGS